MKLVDVTNDQPDEYEFRKVQAIMGDLSFCVVLPKKFAIDLELTKGDYVKIFQKQHSIVIQKA